MSGSTSSAIFRAIFSGVLVLLVHQVCAREFKVGGSKGWSVPADNISVSYNQWAETNRFQIGDSLLFTYAPYQDSVLRVTFEAYTNCNTEAPIEKLWAANGRTSFKFNQSGPYYFITGNKNNCLKNQKLHVVVLADRTKPKIPVLTPAPSPAVPEASSPPTPSPLPSPAGLDAPSPPAIADINPTAAPSEEFHPAKSASSVPLMKIMGSVGAFAFSTLLVF